MSVPPGQRCAWCNRIVHDPVQRGDASGHAACAAALDLFAGMLADYDDAPTRIDAAVLRAIGDVRLADVVRAYLAPSQAHPPLDGVVFTAAAPGVAEARRSA